MTATRSSFRSSRLRKKALSHISGARGRGGKYKCSPEQKYALAFRHQALATVDFERESSVAVSR